MRTARTVLAAVLLAAAAPASAQLSTHGVSVESGISAAGRGGDGARGAFALTASAWLEGEAEAIARVALRSERETDGRGTAPAVCATAGLRLSLTPDPVRLQVQLEIGWLRTGEGTQALAVGAGGAIEWFPARDLSLAARLALRGDAASPRLEATLAAAAYF